MKKALLTGMKSSAMKTTIIAGGVALLLAITPGAAHAEDWHLHRTCNVIKTFDDPMVMLDLKEVQELQKFIPALKKCTAFGQCLKDREAGKVKHCYENDKRWR
jgi:hypothetical protein